MFYQEMIRLEIMHGDEIIPYVDIIGIDVSEGYFNPKN